MQTQIKNYPCFLEEGLPKTARYWTALVAVVVPCGESRMAKNSQSRMAHHFRLVVQVAVGGDAEKISALGTHLIIQIPMTTHTNFAIRSMSLKTTFVSSMWHRNASDKYRRNNHFFWRAVPSAKGRTSAFCLTSQAAQVPLRCYLPFGSTGTFIGFVHPVNPRITAFFAYYVVDQPNLLLLVPGTLTPGRPMHTRFFHQYVNMHTHSLWPRWLRRAQVFCLRARRKQVLV